MKLVSKIIGFASVIGFLLLATLVLFFPYFTMPIYGTLTFFMATTFAWLVINKKNVLRFFAQKSTIYGANLSFLIFLVVGIVVFLNIIAKDNNYRKDITRSAKNTLSPQTLKIIHGLTQDINVLYFNNIQDRESSEFLFKNYLHESKKIHYEFVDTLKQPSRTISMGVKKNDVMVLSLENTNKKIVIEGVSEEKITNGIIKLLRDQDKVVYFLVGHKEYSISSAEDDPVGLSGLKSELEKQGYKIKELNLMSEGKIPSDAAVVTILSPQAAFFPKELSIFSDWLRKSGRAFIAVDLDISNKGFFKGGKQIANLMKSYGVDIHDKILVDPISQQARIDPQILLGFTADLSHPITKDFPHSSFGLVPNFLFPLTTYLTHLSVDNVQVYSLVKTSPQAITVSDWKAANASKDIRGQFDIAYALETKNTSENEKNQNPTRITVISNARFLTNSGIDKNSNRDLVLNSFAWLTNDEQLISIRSNEEAPDHLNANFVALNILLLVIVFIVPVIFIAIGIFTWRRRLNK